MALDRGWWYVAGVGDAAELELRERFVGPWARGQGTPRTGARRGALEATRMVAELTIHVDDVSACIDDADHRVRVSGQVQIDGLLARALLTGEARLYLADADVGMKRCEYRLRAATLDGTPVYVNATSFFRPGRATRAERETLYVRVLSDEQPATVIGAGVIRRRVCDRWQAPGARTWAYTRWRRFVEREIRAPVPPVAS